MADGRSACEEGGMHRTRRTHFLRWIEPGATASRKPEPNGATLFRDRLLREAGQAVVSIPYFEWDALRDDDARDAYIMKRFEAVTR